MTLALLMLVPAAGNAQKWLKLTSPHFELYTTAGERDGKAALLRFEQVRDFFIKVGMPEPKLTQKVQIVGFDSTKEFEPYRPTENAFAYYQPGFNRDYIVMQNLGADTFPVAVHEYVHLLVRHSGLEVPVWLNEGLAEFYSTLKPWAGKVQVGELIQGHGYTLSRTKFLDLETLTTVDRNSPHYNEKSRTQIFYAQSWALVHMLQLSDFYRPKHGEFFRAITSGTRPAEAFQSIYGKSMEQVLKELNGYLRGDWFKVAYFDTKLERAIENPDIQPADPVQVGLTLANLLNRPDKQDAVGEMLGKLAADHPDNSDVAEAQGYHAWRTKGSYDAAKPFFEKAVKSGSGNARLHYDYAMMLRSSGADGEIQPLLERAVALQPEFPDAHFALAHVHYSAGEYAKVVAQLARMGTVDREDALNVFHLLADAYYRLGERDEAKKAAARAKQYADTPERLAQIEEFIEYLSGDGMPGHTELVQLSGEEYAEYREAGRSTEDPPRREGAAPGDRPRLTRRLSDTPMESEGYSETPRFARMETIAGTLLVLDCLGEPGARLTVMAGRQMVPLLIADPTAVAITGVPGDTFDFVCGPQKPVSVSVEYEATENEELGTLGIVRAIQFR
jgi:tetratricopeptide (TPR) repeat protein